MSVQFPGDKIYYSASGPPQVYRSTASKQDLPCKIQAVISETEEKTRIAILNRAYSGSVFMKEAISMNNSILDLMRREWSKRKLDLSPIESMEENVEMSFKMFEENVKEIIGDCFRQVREITGFTNDLINSIESLNVRCVEAMAITLEKFEASMQKVIRNADASIELNKRYADLIYELNKKLKEDFESKFGIAGEEKNNMPADFTDWVSEWWKENGKEAAA